MQELGQNRDENPRRPPCTQDSDTLADLADLGGYPSNTNETDALLSKILNSHVET